MEILSVTYFFFFIVICIQWLRYIKLHEDILHLHVAGGKRRKNDGQIKHADLQYERNMWTNKLWAKYLNTQTRECGWTVCIYFSFLLRIIIVRIRYICTFRAGYLLMKLRSDEVTCAVVAYLNHG